MPPMCMYKSDDSGEIKDFHKYHYVSKSFRWSWVYYS